jgi:hypothetical protein
MSVSAGGSTQTDTLIALAIVGVWIVVGALAGLQLGRTQQEPAGQATVTLSPET